MGAGSDLTGTRHLNTACAQRISKSWCVAERQHSSTGHWAAGCGHAVAAAVLRASGQAGRQTPAALALGAYGGEQIPKHKMSTS